MAKMPPKSLIWAASSERFEYQNEDFDQRASENRPSFIPNLDELKLGFAEWLRGNIPQALWSANLSEDF
jgi:hypothetical protein